MTRKHFQAVAETVRFLDLPEEVRKDRETLRRHIAEELAGVLAGFNGRFDRERFLKACQPCGTEGNPARLDR